MKHPSSTATVQKAPHAYCSQHCNNTNRRTIETIAQAEFQCLSNQRHRQGDQKHSTVEREPAESKSILSNPGYIFQKEQNLTAQDTEEKSGRSKNHGFKPTETVLLSSFRQKHKYSRDAGHCAGKADRYTRKAEQAKRHFICQKCCLTAESR